MFRGLRGSKSELTSEPVSANRTVIRFLLCVATTIWPQMPKLKPDIQRARREHILDAAERCFAHAGFHRTTMQDICKEAGVSPGALYVYFTNKEDLIAGISERDRADFAERFAQLAEAPDFMEALEQLGNHYFEQEPAYKKLMCIEIGLESTRNPR
ncbi:MAG TPA: helix-turn-helix domain-containing protein, partial [Hyphomicrobiaceae bacterium]